MTDCALITGASKGIGRATAETFLTAGYRVVNISRSACDLDGVDNLKIDMTRPNWVANSGAQILEAVGDVTSLSLVHNSAWLRKDRIDDVHAEDFRKVLELNVVAPALLTNLVMPRMSSGSSIIYIASTLGHKAVANSCSYVTSKHALIGLMRSSCQDLAGTGIHTAAVCPGFTDTEMLRSHIGTNADVEAGITANIALGRLIEPSEIADVVYFCSRNPVLNGAVIDANLGQIER